VTTLLRECL
jgi:telomerase reverse transcriptase